MYASTYPETFSELPLITYKLHHTVQNAESVCKRLYLLPNSVAKTTSKFVTLHILFLIRHEIRKPIFDDLQKEIQRLSSEEEGTKLKSAKILR